MLIAILKLLKNRKGATAIEYGLITALISLAGMGAWQSLDTHLVTTFNVVSSQLH